MFEVFSHQSPPNDLPFFKIMMSPSSNTTVSCSDRYYPIEAASSRCTFSKTLRSSRSRSIFLAQRTLSYASHDTYARRRQRIWQTQVQFTGVGFLEETSVGRSLNRRICHANFIRMSEKLPEVLRYMQAGQNEELLTRRSFRAGVVNLRLEDS